MPRRTKQGRKAYSKEYKKKNKAKVNKAHREWYAKHKTRLKEESYVKRFNITIGQYNELFEEQGGCCAVCGTHQTELRRALAVDHNHSCCSGRDSCGKCVRGLLCDKCNFMIGQSNDSAELLKKAISYLNKFIVEQ